MRKQQKQLIILLVILLVLAAVFWGLKQYNNIQSQQPQEKTDIMVVDLNSEEIVRFSYENEGVKYSFEKEDGIWYYAEDKTLTLNQDRIALMIDKVSPMIAGQVIENVTDMTKYGLDEPLKILQFETPSESVILHTGDYNSVSSIYYICKPSETTVYTVESPVVTIFDDTLEDLIEETEETDMGGGETE